MSKKLKLIFIIILQITVISVFYVAGINIHMINYSSKYIADDIKELSEIVNGSVQTVIIFGAYVYDNGQPCLMLEDRLLTGIKTFESGIAERIILSGDHGTRGYDEVNAMKTFTLDQGISKEVVFLDHAGFSTYDSVVRASEVFQVKSAVLSTQQYHLPRAVYIARKNGIEAYGIAADQRNYPKSEMMRYILREWLARVKDFFYVNILKPEPVYLGAVIPITGGSDSSYDMPDDLS